MQYDSLRQKNDKDHETVEARPTLRINQPLHRAAVSPMIVTHTTPKGLATPVLTSDHS